MTYGEMIRKIRLEKGFAQKDIYNNIVSKSYAIEFEKGNHDLSFRLLLQVLDRLTMDLNEFIFILNYSSEQTKTFWERFEIASNNHDLKNLEELHKVYSDSEKKIDIALTAMISARYSIIKNFKSSKNINNDQVAKEDIDAIVGYLESIQTWTLEEIQLYSNTMGYFPYDQQVIFFNNSLKKIDMYQYYPLGSIVYSKLLINSCGNFISVGDFINARKSINHLRELTKGLDGVMFNLYYIFFHNLILYCTKEQILSERNILNILNTFSELGFPYLGEQCFDFYTQIKKIYPSIQN